MTKTTALNQEAILQYQNEFKGIYVMVFEDLKPDMQTMLAEYKPDKKFDSDFDKYADYMIESRGFSRLNNGTINGLKAKTLKTTKMIPEGMAYYHIALIDGKEHYYQLITGSDAIKEAKNRDAMKMIIESFTYN